MQVVQLGIKSVKRSAIAKCTILKLKNKKEEFSPLLLSSKCIFCWWCFILGVVVWVFFGLVWVCCGVGGIFLQNNSVYLSLFLDEMHCCLTFNQVEVISASIFHQEATRSITGFDWQVALTPCTDFKLKCTLWMVFSSQVWQALTKGNISVHKCHRLMPFVMERLTCSREYVSLWTFPV